VTGERTWRATRAHHDGGRRHQRAGKDGVCHMGTCARVSSGPEPTTHVAVWRKLLLVGTREVEDND
jgi:hypothetical protein